MSDERVSARPANLAKFVAASRQINHEIKAKVAMVQADYGRFPGPRQDHSMFYVCSGK